MIDGLVGWGIEPAPVGWADSAYGDATQLRLGLEQREIPYVLDVKFTTSALGPEGHAEPLRPRLSGPRSAAGGPLPAAVQQSEPRWPRPPIPTRGSRSAGARAPAARCARASSRCASGRPTSSCVTPTSTARLPVCWLLAEWPRQGRPTRYWLSNLPADTPPPALVGLAKLRWRIEHDYREMKEALGLAHFEGRTWPAGTTTSPSSPSPTASDPATAGAPKDTAPA